MYAIDNACLKQCQIKILKSFVYQTCTKLKNINNDNFIYLNDISYNANYNIKYSYELLNIINSYGDFNSCLYNNIPLFLTITLDGCYRRMLKGNYSEFNEVRLKKEFPKHLRYKYYSNIALSIKDCYEIVCYQHKKMRDRYLNKYKIKYCFQC